MPGCQVIKSNDRWCRNYSRKGMSCCWVHRNLEDTVIEMAPTKVSGEPGIMQCILTGNLFMKFKQPEDGREWPTLDEARNVIEEERINNYEALLIFQRIWMKVAESEKWSKYEHRMLALVFLEFHFISNGPFSQSLFDTIVKKLEQANYDPVYLHIASQLKSI